MKMRYQYRICPNKTKIQQLANIGGACRYVYNYFLTVNKDQYAIDQKFIWYSDMCKQLTLLKKQPGKEWLTQVSAQALQQSLRDLDQALKNIKHGKGFPVFKSKYTTPYSFRLPQKVIISEDKRYVSLPKVGEIRIKLHKNLPEYKSCTFFQDTTSNWYSSFVVEGQGEALPSDITNYVGVDMNSEHTALSDGTLIPNLRPMRSKKAKHKLYQQRLSRKKKGSKNRRKQQIKLARLDKHIANQRKNDLHKTSKRIAKANDLVVVETLSVKEMMQKSHLTAKAAADVSWGMFAQFLAYKSRLYGTHFIKLNKWLPSSKKCSACGHKKDKIPLSIREYICESCDYTEHRDINAAKNIAKWGYQQWSTEQKTGQELPGVPVDLAWDILLHSGDITQTEMKQEAILASIGQ